ncbi:hypothetical protein [Protofrankia symbiont of Coriaria ruscifolia]|uniref:Putative secreted protein n=1 Tax=Candidatus Protofrankia californiensis TaxID=1839754 RepID=A0A1C3PGL3_9ACTN|nr:hypothetical protein [Protofrankia symbiont of Coriaria ruscifolia]SBW28778.1 putative secreted protein [Candidatus Protofrankia californiensis]
MILLRIRPSLPDGVCAASLAPEEAHHLAEALTNAALTACEPCDQVRVPNTNLSHTRSNNTPSHEHAVTICEGTTVSDLSWLLGELPAHARLVDFASDTDVVLVFSTDGAHTAVDHG